MKIATFGTAHQVEVVSLTLLKLVLHLDKETPIRWQKQFMGKIQLYSGPEWPQM
jgi:hypothetical protein